MFFIKKIFWIFYNFFHKTKIKSIYASRKAVYGKYVLIDRDTVIDSDVIIGDYSYVNKHSSLEHCRVGKFCSISSGVYICPYEHDLNGLSTHPYFLKKLNIPKREEVIIGNDVLISLNCIILAGVHIGDGAVIGAGAVVTKDVGEYEVVGGVPARHLGYRNTLKMIEYMKSLNWWNLKEDEIDNLYTLQLDGH